MLFLDEIQECPNARTALKFLATDDRCDVIASGSLLGIKFKKGRKRKAPKSIPVGFERQVTMHSLSFREYLRAVGYGDDQLAVLAGYFERRETVPDAINDKFNALVREYIVIGGMPKVVSTYLENRNHGEAQVEQEKILAAYVDDIHKYAEAPDIPKIEDCYRAIPRILAAENHKFKYSEVEKGGTARKYLASVEWLRGARLVSMAECVQNLECGISAYVRDSWFKLYFADVGLLSSMYGMPVKRKILDGTLAGSMKGGVYENFLAGVLERAGFPLYYYKTEQGDAEVEFVLMFLDKGVGEVVTAVVGCRQLVESSFVAGVGTYQGGHGLYLFEGHHCVVVQAAAVGNPSRIVVFYAFETDVADAKKQFLLEGLMEGRHGADIARLCFCPKQGWQMFVGRLFSSFDEGDDVALDWNVSV